MEIKMKIKPITLAICFALSPNCYAFEEDEDDDIGLISLEDLMNIKVTVASGSKGMTVRESPGIVTLITKAEIKNSGARDLVDVLNLVPGFTFAVDVQGVVGISARGNWSHEGKISLMIDDMEMNELSFATLQFGNHYPVDIIERIEIIRGPGSAIYGGFAEMGVIKIITKNAETLKATEGSVIVGSMENGASRTSGSIATGHKFDNGSISANLFYGLAERSDRDFSDFYDDTYNMKGNSDLNDLMFNIGFKYGDFSGRYLLDRYDVTQRDIFFVNAPYAVKQNFESDFMQLKYDWQVSDDLSIAPEIIIKKQKPWKSNTDEVVALEALDPDSYEGQFFNEDLQRTTFKVIGSYDLNETDNLVFGVSYFEDEDKTVNFKYDSTAVFAQSVINTSFGNVTVGGRWEDNSVAGSTFLPRLGYTNAWEKSHIKVLWSKAFRAPVIQNILDFNDPDSPGGIKPENTTVFEIEAGYKLSDNLLLTANIYDIVIDDPIVYFFDDDDSYRNYETVGTRGFELESRYKDSWGYLTATYSYYQVGDNQVDQYAIRDVDPDFDDDITPLLDQDQLLGMPSQKFTLSASYTLNDTWRINPSLIFEGSKYGYVGVTQDDDEQLIAKEFGSTTRLNFNVIGEDIFTDNLELQVGVFNLFDEDVDYIQPYYDGYHAPLPGSTRELFVRASFEF
jgi:outer membrane receptor protein involved in Fe transport